MIQPCCEMHLRPEIRKAWRTQMKHTSQVDHRFEAFAKIPVSMSQTERYPLPSLIVGSFGMYALLLVSVDFLSSVYHVVSLFSSFV